MKRNIIWLASYPKSGNTWFRIFLAHLMHPKDENIHINNLNFAPNAASRSLFDSLSAIPSSDLSGEEIMNLRPHLYNQLAAKEEKLLFLKAHDAWQKTPDSNDLFPVEVSHSAVYFIRNPLDIVISFANHLGKDYQDVIKIISNEKYSFNLKPTKLHTQFNQKLSSWSKHVSSWTRQDKFPVQIVKYEDMIENTSDCFSDICKRLGMTYQEDEINTALKKCSFKVLQDYERKHGFREKPIGVNSFFNSGKSKQFIGKLTNRQIDEIKEQHRTVMALYNYL